MTDYLEKRRRHKAKKMLRLQKPWLMGALLEQEVDRVLGVADSGKLDWTTLIESGKRVSEYPTPESVIPKVIEIADKYGVHAWSLYYRFKRKVLKLVASGRKKSDYLALLTEVAATPQTLNEAEKIQAICLFSEEVLDEKPPLTSDQAHSLLIMKGW